MQRSSWLLLLPLCLLSSCARVTPTGTRTTTVETNRTGSHVFVVPPAEPLPWAPDSLRTWTSGSLELRLPLMQEDTKMEGSVPTTLSRPQWSASGEASFYPKPFLRTSIGTIVNSKGLQSAWTGVALLHRGISVLSTLRPSLGIQRITSENTYLESVSIHDCPAQTTCRDTSTTRIRPEYYDVFKPFLRLGASFQPMRSGPWIDLQWTSAMSYASWTPRTVTSKTSEEVQDDCSIWGCSPSTSTRESSTASQEGPLAASLAQSSIAAGWCQRLGSHQLSVGLRAYPGLGTSIQLSAQWSGPFF